MKKMILTSVFMLGIVILLNAQVELKPALGLNFSKLSNEPQNFEQSSRVGFQIGGTTQLGKKLYFEPGVFWLKMGSELVNPDSVSLDYKYDITAIKIPVFVGYQIIGGDEENFFGLRVFGGPTASWVTKIEAGDVKVDNDNFSDFIWGIDAGAGVDVWIFFLDLGYEWGLSKVFKNDPEEAKNNVFWGNLGIRIRFN